MIKHKLKEKVLAQEGETFLPGHPKPSEYRFLPKEFFDPTSTVIFGNNVGILIFGEPVYVIKIKSKKVSDAYRKQFYLLWKNARKMKKIK